MTSTFAKKVPSWVTGPEPTWIGGVGVGGLGQNGGRAGGKQTVCVQHQALQDTMGEMLTQLGEHKVTLQALKLCRSEKILHL